MGGKIRMDDFVGIMYKIRFAVEAFLKKGLSKEEFLIQLEALEKLADKGSRYFDSLEDLCWYLQDCGFNQDWIQDQIERLTQDKERFEHFFAGYSPDIAYGRTRTTDGRIMTFAGCYRRQSGMSVQDSLLSSPGTDFYREVPESMLRKFYKDWLVRFDNSWLKT